MTRRDNGTGSLRFWRGAWWAEVQLAGGRRVRRKRRTEEAARLALAELLSEYADRLGYFYSLPRPHYYGQGAPPTRPGVSPRLRFAVLTRDRFTCRYCGHSAPDVPLHVDHVMPVAAGGTDDMDNLVTSCQDCNLGKAAQVLP